MKRAIIGIAFGLVLLSFGNVSAQVGTSMQFNQVVLLEFNSGPSPIYTVPAGKIWKIESAGTRCGVEILSVNGNTNGGGVDIGESIYEARLPLWLPENTTIGFDGGCGGEWSFVSIIEFTVVP